MWGEPVAGSNICSALPWSAVTISAPPLASVASTILPTHLVYRFDGFDGGVELAGVADHVSVGEVH